MKKTTFRQHPLGPLIIPTFSTDGAKSYKGSKLYPDSEHAVWLAWGKACGNLTDLMVRADEGNRDALRLLFSLFRDYVADFMFMLRKHRENALAVTVNSMKIPVVVGPNQDYWTAARDLVDELRVGSVAALDLKQSATGKRGRRSGKLPSTPRNAVAISLMEFIEMFRGHVRLRRIVAANPRLARDPELVGWAKSATELPDFSSETVSRWAEVGIEILEQTVGADLTTDRVLSVIGASAREKYKRSKRGKTAALNRKLREQFTDEPSLTGSSRADMNARIRGEIRSAFVALARSE